MISESKINEVVASVVILIKALIVTVVKTFIDPYIDKIKKPIKQFLNSIFEQRFDYITSNANKKIKNDFSKEIRNKK